LKSEHPAIRAFATVLISFAFSAGAISCATGRAYRRHPPVPIGEIASEGVHPSVGCAHPRASGDFTDVLLVATSSHGVVMTSTRSFILAVPPDIGETPTPRSLVFGWHAANTTAEALRTQGVERFARLSAIFVYPNATRLSDGSVGWNPSLESGDIAFFDALYRHITEGWCVDESRVFSYGFSYGAYMTNLLACHRGQSLRGIAALSGGGPIGACTASVAAFLTHATDDPVVPFSESEKSLEHWLHANGCERQGPRPVDPAAPGCVAYRGCAPGRPVVWCPRPWGGHAWPDYGAAAVWRFFHTL
jgi:poly(3-hydroxybutyrate) depolymerase